MLLHTEGVWGELTGRGAPHREGSPTGRGASHREGSPSVSSGWSTVGGGGGVRPGRRAGVSHERPGEPGAGGKSGSPRPHCSDTALLKVLRRQRTPSICDGPWGLGAVDSMG